MYFLHITFMVPFIVNVFKHNQQDATLRNVIYYYKCSTCFRGRFLRPSSGAQNYIHSIGLFVELLLLLTAGMKELERTHDSAKKQKKARQIPDADYTVSSS